MKVLSVDTSSKVATVAVLRDGEIILEKESEDQKTHSEKIVPLVDSVLEEANLELKDIDEFCVCIGPGSFTGIRIGVSLVKAMAEALNKKVVGVSSLCGLINAANTDNVCAMIDALHDNVYCQYKIGNDYSTPDCKNINELIEELKIKNTEITFIGNGVLSHRALLTENIKCKFNEVEFSRASDLGLFSYKNNLKSEEAYKIVPIYLRKAQPER
ncbi:MAG: tRNA (adenosine(37)-N6)-threonylcarbamoyltransferase complex dimerization subunit type 1 TsaB [Clostridia bacterium]|nr:tRNA (adenosine(37)-N6)-threonylcarbamoyltransferase complex dimerization subunit type 1 TsaB [Clostridia bacterium]